MLEDFQVNGTAGVPTVYLGLMDHMSASSGRKLNHLKLAICGGAACPRKIFDFFNRYCDDTLLPARNGQLRLRAKAVLPTQALSFTGGYYPLRCYRTTHAAEAACTQLEITRR